MGNCCHPFDAYVQDCCSSFRLARAGLLYALDRYPTLDVDHYLRKLDALAERVHAQGACSTEDRVAALRSVLAEEEGFRGQSTDFCDPQSSYLNRVLERKRGLPITLSAIWLDVAKLLNWPLYGVGMPGRFILGCQHENGEHRYYDPFTGGCPLKRDDCAQLLAQCFQSSVPLSDAHLAPVDSQAVLFRMLGNLRALYCARQQWPCVEQVLHRMLALNPGDCELADEVCRVRSRIGEQN